MTAWLIGEAPTRYTTKPFTGRSATKLNDMAGFNVREVFKCTNVLDHWPGSAPGKGARFPIGEAREGAQRILGEVDPSDWVILVGGRVAKKAFRMKEDRPYIFRSLMEVVNIPFPKRVGVVQVSYIPHPSGLNQHWNDSSNVQRFQEFMQSLRVRTS